jgi:hypothetical protein|tara:strand:+ start:544 stop:735 length:192 start_codon:yes stop_codon:yes gene_type:complete
MATVTEISVVAHPPEDRGSVSQGSQGYRGTFIINAKGRGQKVFRGNSAAAVRAAAVAYGETLG